MTKLRSLSAHHRQKPLSIPGKVIFDFHERVGD